MFNRKKFIAMLDNMNVTKKDLASYLGISIASLYRRMKDNGNFTANEIRLMINFFGKDEVISCMFNYE